MWIVSLFNYASKASLALFLLLSLLSYKSGPRLKAVTVKQFAAFVEATGYTTDAENYGWSFVQKNVFDFDVVEGANWLKPDGNNPPSSNKLPVTQVSYNDALAYCEWSGSKLPTYGEYWNLVAKDKRKVNAHSLYPLAKVNKVNVLGNAWEITATEQSENIRLAGGSHFCAPSTCNGTVKERELFIDKSTGNLHIGFAVID